MVPITCGAAMEEVLSSSFLCFILLSLFRACYKLVVISNINCVSSDSTTSGVWKYLGGEWTSANLVGPSNRIRAAVVELEDSVKIYGGITGTIYLNFYSYSHNFKNTYLLSLLSLVLETLPICLMATLQRTLILTVT